MSGMRAEGFVEVPGGRVWYESAGSGERTLLLLHGGPGATSGYLEPLMALADDGYRVVRYDQLGSFKSDKPDDLSLWQVPRFVEELEAVRQALDLGQVNLLGQSWGAILALEYAIHHQDRLESLILYSGAASIVECVAGMNDWRGQLPAETIATLDRYEASGEYTNPAYLDAMEILYRRHLCRIWPYPEPMANSIDKMAEPVYHTMWGPNEFTCTGNLLSWDRADRLSEITVPTLILGGRYDEVSPGCAETLHRGIPGSELVCFEDASHVAHLEQPDQFYPVLRAFLNRTAAVPSNR